MESEAETYGNGRLNHDNLVEGSRGQAVAKLARHYGEKNPSILSGIEELSTEDAEQLARAIMAGVRRARPPTN